MKVDQVLMKVVSDTTPFKQIMHRETSLPHESQIMDSGQSVA